MERLMKKKIVAVWVVIMILCSVSFVMAGGGKEAGGETDTANGIVIQHWYHQYGEEGTYEAVQRYAKEYSEKPPV